MKKFVYDFLFYVLSTSRSCTWVPPKALDFGDALFVPEVGDFIMSVSASARSHFHEKLRTAFRAAHFNAEEYAEVFKDYIKNASHLTKHTASLNACNLFGFAAESALMFLNNDNHDGINLSAELLCDSLLELFTKRFLREYGKLTVEELIFTEFAMCTSSMYEVEWKTEYYRRTTLEVSEKARCNVVWGEFSEEKEPWDQVMNECQVGQHLSLQQRGVGETSPTDSPESRRRELRNWNRGSRETWAFVDAFVKHTLKSKNYKWKRTSGEVGKSRYFTKYIGDGILELCSDAIQYYKDKMGEPEPSFDLDRFCERFYDLASKWTAFGKEHWGYMELCSLFALLAVTVEQLHRVADDYAITCAADVFVNYFVSEVLYNFLKRGGYAAFAEFVNASMAMRERREAKMKKLERLQEKTRRKIIRRIKKKKEGYKYKENWQSKFLESSPTQKIVWEREERWQMPSAAETRPMVYLPPSWSI